MSTTRIACPALILIAVVCLFCQPASAQQANADTVRTVFRNPLPVDSLRLPLVAIPLVGSLGGLSSSGQTYPDSIIDFMNYKDVGDLLSSVPGMFMRNLGSPGQLNGITIQGVDGRGVTFMSDGILLNEPLTGAFNPNLLPTENIDRLEIVTGTQAFLYGLNSTGGAINVMTKSKKALHPYSRLRYSQSGYDYGYIDGLVSQDITRGLNVTAGFQHVTYGGRFPNSDDDAWNARAKLRYNISNKINVYFSEDYNQTQLGLNGGVDTATLPDLRFDRINAAVRNADSYEKVTRHDLQLGAALRAFADSEAVMMLTLYHSTNFREYRDEENRPAPNGLYVKQDHLSEWGGARVTQVLRFRPNSLFLGAEVQRLGVIASPVTGQHIETATNVFGKDDVLLSDDLRVSGYARLDHHPGNTPLSCGGDATFSPFSNMEFFVGYSRSFRFPTFQELYWRDSMVTSRGVNFPPERHHLWQVGGRYASRDGSSVEVSLFHRTIFDAIEFVPTGRKYPFPTLAFVVQHRLILQGCTASAGFRVGDFWAEGSLQYLEQIDDGGYQRTLPRWSGNGGIYFWNKLVNGHLDLKAGLQGHFVGSYRGTEFNPQVLAFVPSSQSDVDLAGTSDAVIIAHLGSAYVHVIWENLFDRKYVVVPFYPMPDRMVRFGVSWEFTD